MQQASYDFPVELQQLRTPDGKVSKRKAVVRTDTNTILADVTSQYKLAYQHTIVGDGAKVLGEYDIRDVTGEVKVGDVVGMRINALATYDGKSAIRLTIGGLRLSCLNGMVVANCSHVLRFAHKGDQISAGGQLVDVKWPEISTIVNGFKLGAIQWGKLAALQLPAEDLNRYQQLAINDGIVTENAVLKGNPLEEPTAWGLYNKFTHYITHQEKATASPIGKLIRFNKVENWFQNVFAA